MVIRARLVGLVLLGGALLMSGGCADIADPDPPPTLPVTDQCYRIGPEGWVFFGLGEATLTVIAKATLDKRIDRWKADGAVLLLVGSTDTVGTVADNERLSLARAYAVKSYLTERGMPAADLQTVGAGFSKRLVNTALGVAEPQNRNVVIRLVSQERDSTNCWAKLKKPYEEWFGRNCKPAPKDRHASMCDELRSRFYLK